MSGFWFHWLHHTQNFPSGFFLLGLPLFALNRLAKGLLFVAALVILIDILGPATLERSVTTRHERFPEWMELYDIRRRRMSQELGHLLRLFFALFRSLIRKEAAPSPIPAEDRGPASHIMGIVLLTLFGIAAFLNAILVPIFVSTWDASLLIKVFYGLALFVFSCALWWLGILLLFFGSTSVLWLINAAILRPLDAVWTGLARFVLRHVHDKGAAHSWRVASLSLLLLGFLLDMLSS